MAVYASEDLGKGEHLSISDKTTNMIATGETSVEVPQIPENPSTIIPSYTTLEHIPKGLYMLLQIYLLKAVH